MQKSYRGWKDRGKDKQRATMKYFYGNMESLSSWVTKQVPGGKGKDADDKAQLSATKTENLGEAGSPNMLSNDMAQ